MYSVLFAWALKGDHRSQIGLISVRTIDFITKSGRLTNWIQVVWVTWPIEKLIRSEFNELFVVKDYGKTMAFTYQVFRSLSTDLDQANEVNESGM